MASALIWKSETLPIAGITELADLKARDVNAATVAKYASAYRSGLPLPALKAARMGKVVLLVDGWHRLAAARDAGLTELTVETAKMTREQAKVQAAIANTQHGRALSSQAERKRALTLYCEGDGHVGKSLREIAADLGGAVTHVTVRNHLKAMGVTQPKGGAFDLEKHEAATQDRLAQTAHTYIRGLETAFGGMVGAEARWEALEELKATLERMVAAGNAREPEAAGAYHELDI